MILDKRERKKEWKKWIKKLIKKFVPRNEYKRYISRGILIKKRERKEKEQ